MDALHLSNSLSSVQVIPIFNYLSIISDFLFLENYLPEVDQYKPIPVVNELYRYFEENRANQNKTLLLIRNMLNGTDLYGEQENETPDETFITIMFDYIISSLVFAKYGNIYGFLAYSVRQVDNLKIDSVLERIEENLKIEIYENEYGDSSMLTPLSVSRIFREIILPLLPQPLFNMNVLSFDYFYALAGSTYLRLGKLNETYYSNFNQFNSQKTIYRISFSDYVLIGFIIESFYSENVDHVALKAFALPALFYYVSIASELYDEAITNVIFNPQHWKKAYSVFFDYLKSTSNEIKTQLQNDYTYKIHRAFSNFLSRAKYAKLVLDYQCRHSNDYQRESKIDIYIDNADHYKCRGGDFLPNINDWFMDQIDAFGELYKKYDYGMMQEIFNESSIDLRDIAVNLIVTNDKVENEDFSTSQHLSYDLLEFHNMIANTIEYYAIVRENYTVKLVKESDDQEYFQQLIGPSKNSFIHSSERILLKDTYESPETLCQVITNYKKQRFLSYLNYSDNSPEKSKWWREFGFSFVPLYPCVSDINHYGELSTKLCEKENIKFLNKYPEVMSTDLISNSTQIMLSSFGTSIKSVFLKEYLHNSVISQKALKYKPGLKFQEPTDEFYENLSLQLEEPKYEILWFTEDKIRFMIEILNYSSVEIKKTFKYAKNALYKLLLIKGTFIINLNNRDSNYKLNESVFIKSWNGVTGYGYKFTLADDFDNQTSLASLITGYEFNKTTIYDLILHKSLFIKINLKFKNRRIKCSATEIICKNTEQSSNSIQISFKDILSYYHNDDKCITVEYLQKSINSSVCLRHKNYIQKLHDEDTILKDVLKNTNKDPLLEDEVRSRLQWYTFPNKTASVYFLTNWIKDRQFANSVWSQDNIIDTSGVLYVLLYNITLDNRFMTKSVAKSKIHSRYTYRERSKIEEEKSVESLLREYEVRRGYYSASFEDYYAIRNFITTGYERIMSDTHEAKLMKLALYRLALRQSIDFDEKYDLKLYIFQSVSEDIFRKKFMKGNSEIADLRKNFTLQKFLLTVESEEIALRFTKSPSVGFRNVLYEINFSSFYLRGVVNVDVKMNFREKRIIILPGNKFHLENILPVPTVKIGTYFKVVLTSTSEGISKYKQFKNVLREMSEIVPLTL
ncbi:uncharacterized protein LOC122508693 [Leptopilina heterotoma]|uniref:uncharacterized protein LOC122508693 n=1 Tax=Leptopilina heterotoma TaxID=63436 RepID=UPI001CA96CBC|nr:uncharacterized protein LOC122508693 [Leptopilina heterotoma]